MENSMEAHQKNKNRTTIWPSNPTPGDLSRENHNSKRYMHLSVHCSMTYNGQDMETTQMSINRGMDKDVVHIYNWILHSHEKEWNNAICSRMDGPRDIHTKWNKKEKNRSMISFIGGIQIWYKWPYLQNRYRLTAIGKKTNGYQRGKGGRDKLGVRDWQIHITIYIYMIDKQQGTTAWHKELYSIFYIKL